MGVIKRGILGGFSGKVANLVGGSWKGIAYIRSLPLSVANPRTAAQTAQRSSFSGVVAFAKLILVSTIKPLWDRFAQGMSGYNAFVSANIDAFDSNGDLTPADLITSEGSLLGVDSIGGGGTDGDPDVAILWVDNSGTGNGLATDTAYIVVYNETQDTVGTSSAIDTRTDTSATVTMPADQVSGDVVHIYGAFRKADGTLVSNSAYVTSTVV